ncbi:unnamed protein product, partial [Mesorhabditis spiculigera]
MTRRISMTHGPSEAPLDGGPRLLPQVFQNLGQAQVGLRENRNSITTLRQFHQSPHSRFSQPDLLATTVMGQYGTVTNNGQGTPPSGYGSPRRVLPVRLQEQHSSESTPSRDLPIGPVYLALKQATGKYGSQGGVNGSRRGSSAHPLDSHSPSPSTLSRVSLQDSGYVEMPKASPLLGSSPQLDHAGRNPARRRAPKLSQQMKGRAPVADCADVPPRAQPGVWRSRAQCARRIVNWKVAEWIVRFVGLGAEAALQVNTNRRGSAPSRWYYKLVASIQQGGHIVIHEYTPSTGQPLYLGEKLIVVNNGDPDWLHGFRISDRTEQLISFPATCVGKVKPGEQPMRISQNVLISDIKLRLYRDQVVFAQPDSIREGKVLIRTERDVFTACRLEYLSIL